MENTLEKLKQLNMERVSSLSTVFGSHYTTWGPMHNVSLQNYLDRLEIGHLGLERCTDPAIDLNDELFRLFTHILVTISKQFG